MVLLAILGLILFLLVGLFIWQQRRKKLTAKLTYPPILKLEKNEAEDLLDHLENLEKTHPLRIEIESGEFIVRLK